MTPLHWAAYNNDAELTSQILHWRRKDFDPTFNIVMDPQEDKDCFSSLCKKEQINSKRELINIQPVVKKTNDGLFPVDIAGLKGNMAVIKEYILYAQEQIEE